MPALKHTHTYVRRTGGSNSPYTSTFKCADPSCSHWMNAFDLKGKESMCAVCGQNKIILDYEQLRRAKPRCSACSETRENVKKREIVGKLEELFK